jgi:thiol-disulfide isomerase/thioredoxin
MSTLQPATPWSLKFVKGDPVTLQSGHGTTVYVLEFFATWCPFCRRAVPTISDIQRKYQNQNVVVIAIANEPESDVRDWATRMGDQVTYRVACDESGQANTNYMARYGEQGIPCCFIINKQGLVVHHGHPMESRFERKLQEAAGKPTEGARPTAARAGQQGGLQQGERKKHSRNDLSDMKVGELRELLIAHELQLGLLDDSIEALLIAQ